MISIGTPIWQVDASGRFRSIVGTDVVGPSTYLKQSSFRFEVERNQHFLIVFLSVFSQMYCSHHADCDRSLSSHEIVCKVIQATNFKMEYSFALV